MNQQGVLGGKKQPTANSQQKDKYASAEELAKVRKVAENIVAKPQALGMTISQREQLHGIIDRGEKGKTPRQKSTSENPGTYKERERHSTGTLQALKNSTSKGPRQ